MEWPDVTVLSIGLWDMLHIRDVSAYRVELQRMLGTLAQRRPDGWTEDDTGRSLWWVGTPSLQNGKLSPKKQPYMSNALARSYNDAAVEVLACGQFASADTSAGHGLPDGVVDLQGLTSNASAIIPKTTDGIHYADATYDMVAVLVAAAASDG